MRRAWTTIALAVLVLGVTTAQARWGNETRLQRNGVEYYMATDTTLYTDGDSVLMRFRIAVVDPDSVVLAFPTSQRFDFLVDWGQLWDWSQGKVFQPSFYYLTLHRGDSTVATTTWNMRDTFGNPAAPGGHSCIGSLVTWDEYRRPLWVDIQITSSGLQESESSVGRGRGAILLSRGVALTLTAAGWLRDFTGRKVLALHPGANDVSRVAPGIYFVKGPETVDGRPTAVRKIILTR
jgi:hypothetical protein